MKRFFLIGLLAFAPLPLQAAEPPVQQVSLSSAEKSYYALAFSYAMDTMQDGKPYEWKTYSGKGAITPAETFISKSGSTCRSFSESYIIQGIQGGNGGYGCKRKGDEGWCRLREKQALTCAMEKRGLDFAVPVIDLPNVNIKGPKIDISGVSGAIGGTGAGNLPPAPNVSVDMGNVKAPSGEEVADSVTSAAGSVAGPAARGVLGWFQSTFR